MKVRGQATLRGKIARIDGFSRWGEVHGLVAVSLTPLMTCRFLGSLEGVKNGRDPSREMGFVCMHLLGGPGAPPPRSMAHLIGSQRDIILLDDASSIRLPVKLGKMACLATYNDDFATVFCIIKSFTSKSATHELSLLRVGTWTLNGLVNSGIAEKMVSQIGHLPFRRTD